MRLEAIAAELRPRNAWEATDLGAALVRRWLRPVYAAWFAVAAPLFLLLHLTCWGNWWLVPWLLWWLKPLLDRPILYVLARALFGDPPDRRQFRRDLFGLFRRQSFAALTWRRFDPARSFTLPVGQLEGLSGKARRRRLRDLGRPGRGPAIGLTTICLHLEIGLDFALIVLVWMLAPDFVALQFLDLLDDSDALGQLWLNAVSFFGLTLVEPFYVATGFALYLNRRTRLEAWDVEIGFRRLAARLAALGRAAVSAALVLGSISLANPATGLAADRDQHFADLSQNVATASAPISEPAVPPTEETGSFDEAICEQRRQREARLAQADSPIKRALAETLREPELQICERQQRWRLRADQPDKPETPGSRDEGLIQRFASMIEYLLWLVAGLTVALVGWWSWRKLPRPVASGRRRATAPGVPPLSGRNEAIPPPDAGLGAAAWELWRNGQPRESLRLLYRASLSGLSVQYGLSLPSSVTEDECLRLAAARLADPELIGFFRRLTRAWQATAYAHRPPDDATARILCEQWPRHFAAVGESPA